MDIAIENITKEFENLKPQEKIEFLRRVIANSPGEWVELGGKLCFIPEGPPATDEEERVFEKANAGIDAGEGVPLKENEVVQNIRALFGDRSVYMDYFASIRNSQARIEEKLETMIQQALNQFESEVIDKVSVLYNYTSVQLNYFSSIKESLSRIENRVDHLVRQNTDHLEKLREYEREIRLLRAER